MNENESTTIDAETSEAKPESTNKPESNGAQTEPSGGGASDEKDAIAELKGEIDKYKELWMRSAADFDNFRKRSRREAEEAKRAGREEFLKEILPVFDNLDRGIQSAQRATDVKAVSDGLGMVLKQFVDTLARAGITKVPGVGTAFDPSFHEAIQQVETADHAPGTIIAEVQPGYVEAGRLVRAAMVVVAKAKPVGEDG